MHRALVVSCALFISCHGNHSTPPIDTRSSDSPTSVCTAGIPTSQLVPQGDVIYDAKQNLYWLANTNLAAEQSFGIAGINPSGSMTYDTAQMWIAAMNAAAYLGHTNWQLPTTGTVDSSCSSHNMNDFGRGCSKSAMGSLFYMGLEQSYPGSAVVIPSDTIGPFTNVQPSIYWTEDAGSGSGSGAGTGPQTFSFSNGFVGANTPFNFFYAWPMVPHAIGTAPTGAGLVTYLGGQAVYDSATQYTWLADANFAATNSFGITGSSGGYPLISTNGSMEYGTATGAGSWIAAMNAGYLGSTEWQLPSTGGDLMMLYNHLGYSKGQSVLTLTNCVGPFQNVQPYLYWSCERDDPNDPHATCSATAVPAAGFAWSFNFGSGFEGTDLVSKQLYVTAYYPG